MERTFVTVLLVLALAFGTAVNGLQKSDLYPFVPGTDSQLPKQDDVNVEVQLSSPFTFYGKKYSSIFVNDNGVLSFVSKFDQYNQWISFPLMGENKGKPVIAPFLAGVDVTQVGAVYYRVTTDAEVLQRAKNKISQYFVRHSNFKPKNALIVTWSQVGFQGSVAQPPLNNTFQCVVTSDAVNTFVFFLYESINWYTSVNAGGSPQTGTGGNTPEVGFDSGNGIDFENIRWGKDYRNPTDLPTVSNVNPEDPPGFFIYHVSGSSVDPPQCLAFASPQVYPNHASMLGGSRLTFGGSCFGENDDIRFRFSDKDDTSMALSDPVSCDFISAYQAKCVLPLMNQIGDVKASLSTDGGSIWKHVDFTLMPIDSVAPEVFRTDGWTPKWFHATGEPLQITWDKSMFDDNRVDITIKSYWENATGGEYRWMNTTIGSNVPNSGVYSINTGANSAITKNNAMGVIRVTAASKPNGMALTSGLHFLGYLLGEDGYQDDPKTWSNDYCQRWYEEDKKKGEFVDQLNACPCSLEQALADQARFVATPYCDSTKQTPEALEKLDYCFARPNIKHCVLGIIRRTSDQDPDASSNQADSECCYDGDDNLVYAQDSKYGSFSNRISRFSGAVPGLSSANTDLVPYIFCNVMGEDDHHYYREQRPTRDCRDYEPVRPAMVYGDPHFVTFDHVGYTFNGLGEYVVFRTVTNVGTKEVHVQGRFEKVDVAGDTERNATVLTALAIRQNNLDENKIQIERNDITLLTLKVGATGTPQDIGRSSYQQYPEFFVIFPDNPGDGVVPKMILLFRESQIGLVVEAHENILSAMILLPAMFKGKDAVEGLFGNWNADDSDDLKKPDGSILTDTSTESIFTNFGQPWEATDPIFVYTGNDKHDNYQDNNFRPIFTPPTGSVSNAQLDKVCGENKPCRFDYLVTEREAVAAQTAQDAEVIHETMEASEKILMCPFPPTPSHGEKDFIGTARHHTPGSIIRYECNDDYIFFGNSQRECNENGEWSDSTTPECVEVPCGTLNAPEHGSMEVTRDGDVLTATFECEEGAKMEGSKTRTCGQDNKWTGKETTCIKDEMRGGNSNTAVIVVVVIVVIIVVCILIGGFYYFFKKRKSANVTKETRPKGGAYEAVETTGEAADVEMATKEKPSDDDGGFKDKDKDKDKEEDDKKSDKDIEKDSD